MSTNDNRTSGPRERSLDWLGTDYRIVVELDDEGNYIVGVLNTRADEYEGVQFGLTPEQVEFLFSIPQDEEEVRPYMHTKCRHCHLFVDHNPAAGDGSPEFPVAQYVHLIRGDDPLEDALDGNHEPEPGTVATLDWWRENGPFEMKARFEVAEAEKSAAEAGCLHCH